VIAVTKWRNLAEPRASGERQVSTARKPGGAGRLAQPAQPTTPPVTGANQQIVGAARGRSGSEPIRLSDARAPGNSMREHSRRLSKEVASAKSPANLPIISRLPSSAPPRRRLRIRNGIRHIGGRRGANESSSQRKGKRMFAEPTFIVSLSGLCGFILVVEDGEVDAYTPSGDLLGVFGDRIDAAEAMLRCGVHIGRLNH
jgi:hypothetical protein